MAAEELCYMSLSGRAIAGVALAISFGLAIPAGAAGKSKLSVPSSIVKGSSVTSGRAFYRSGIPETSLAGIRLGREAKDILAKWGNPTRITVGSVMAQGPEAVAPAPGMADMMNPYAALAQGFSSAAGKLGLQSNPMGDLPGLPGLGGPSPYGSPMETLPAPGQPSGSQMLAEEEVTWTYDLWNGVTLEFIITDGLITQITTGGRGPWKPSITQSGLQLGDTYKLVLWVCGYPESQQYAGRFLRVSYVNKNRALYTFLNNKLVGITIAMVPQELILK